MKALDVAATQAKQRQILVLVRPVSNAAYVVADLLDIRCRQHQVPVPVPVLVPRLRPVLRAIVAQRRIPAPRIIELGEVRIAPVTRPYVLGFVDEEISTFRRPMKPRP